jgi:hypothetical protein
MQLSSSKKTVVAEDSAELNCLDRLGGDWCLENLRGSQMYPSATSFDSKISREDDPEHHGDGLHCWTIGVLEASCCLSSDAP